MKKKISKEEIINACMDHDSTVLSFPNRGPWGDSGYRGNCSGWIHAFLIWKYRVKQMLEVFAGSGTGYDVCKDMGIRYTGVDLNPTPVRPDILSLDALLDNVPDQIYGTDMVFMHPPYPEIGITYAGNMYPDPEGVLSTHDIGQMSWEKGMDNLNKVVIRYFEAMDKGARMSILMGDVRRKGKCRSMLNDIVKPGELEQVIIKMQHNCVSNGRRYTSKNFVPLVHEYLLVVKKPSPVILDFKLPRAYRMDIRDCKNATWFDVVKGVLQSFGHKVRLDEVYAAIEGHKKCLTNANWKAKVRQVLNQHRDVFCSSERGVWGLVA